MLSQDDMLKNKIDNQSDNLSINGIYSSSYMFWKIMSTFGKKKEYIIWLAFGREQMPQNASRCMIVALVMTLMRIAV